MNDEPTPADVFPPGKYLGDELQARGWTTAELAERSGLSPDTIDLILRGEQPVSAVSSKRLGHAFGANAWFWLDVQQRYDRR